MLLIEASGGRWISCISSILIKYWGVIGWSPSAGSWWYPLVFPPLPCSQEEAKPICLWEDYGVTKAGKKLSFISRFYIREKYAPERDSKVKTGISCPGKQAARSCIWHLCPVGVCNFIDLKKEQHCQKWNLRMRLGTSWKPQVSSS